MKSVNAFGYKYFGKLPSSTNEINMKEVVEEA